MNLFEICSLQLAYICIEEIAIYKISQIYFQQI